MNTMTEQEQESLFTDVDAKYGAYFREVRARETYNAEELASTIIDTEDALRKHLTKAVAKGWVLDGFDVTANLDALAELPIEAKVYVSHKTLVGKEAMIAWGEGDSEVATDFITGLEGYPAGIHTVIEVD